jgi:hypothetical protein
MLDRLAFYLDLLVSQCLPSAAGRPPGLADYVFAAMAAALGIAALWMLGQGLRGRDDIRSRRIKAAVLED